MKLVSEQHDGASVEIIIGEQIAIQLPENPTTGYTWDSDFSVHIDMLLNQFKPIEPVRAGSGGYHRWVIKPTEIGIHRIELDYQRNWESNPMKTFKFTLVVNPVPEPEPKPKEEK